MDANEEGDRVESLEVSWTQSEALRFRKSRSLQGLPEDQLRGVPMHSLFRGLGMEWRSHAEAFTWRPHLTRETRSFDFFFSHDWATSGWLKYFTLLCYFNSWAAAATSFLAGISFGLLIASEVVPNLAVWNIISHLMAWLIFFTWQHLRELIVLRYGFLDRMCIHQQDALLKARSIDCLASYLDSSDLLVVLWSPRYCTRLWCMFEIGCFLLKKHQPEKIHFLPVQLCLVWLLCYSAQLAIFTLTLVFQRVPVAWVDWNETEGKLNLSLTMLFTVCCFFPLYFHLLNASFRDLAELPRQLRSFEPSKAQCFCCSVKHQHPETGEEVMCDRRLIYSILQHWTKEELPLDEVLKKQLKQLLPTVEPLTYSSFLMRPLASAVFTASGPFIGDFMGREWSRWKVMGKPHHVWNGLLPIYIFFASLCMIRISLSIGKMGSRLTRFRLALILQVIVYALVILGLGMAYPVAVALAGTGRKSIGWDAPAHFIPIALVALVMLWSAYLMRYCLCPFRVKRVPRTSFQNAPVDQDVDALSDLSVMSERSVYHL